VQTSVKEFTSKSAKKSTRALPQRTQKTPNRNEASEQELEQVEEVKPSTIRTPPIKRAIFE